MWRKSKSLRDNEPTDHDGSSLQSMPPHDPDDDLEHEHPPKKPPDESGPGPPGEGPQPPSPPHEDDSTHRDDADGFLFVVAYADDAERKRAEYLFNTWDGGEIHKPEGLVRIAEDIDHEQLYQELLVKFRSEQVDAYALSSLDIPETPEIRSIERTVTADPATIRSVLQYLISRKKGEQTDNNEYEVYTHHGRADISLSLTQEEDGTTILVQIEGHPPVIDHLSTYLREELDEFEASR